MEEIIEIKSHEYWFKVVGMLQQNWALIDDNKNGGCKVYFIGDTSGVFDEMEFQSRDKASSALKRNGFALYDEDKKAQKFIAPPKPPFYRRAHPNGKIYSSGRFWR